MSIGFSFTGKPLKDGFCHVVTYSSHVNLGFNRGVLLPDPNKILMGSGKSTRHITIHDQGELERPFLRRYLQAAIEQVSRPAPPTRRSHAGFLKPRPGYALIKSTVFCVITPQKVYTVTQIETCAQLQLTVTFMRPINPLTYRSP